MANGKWQNLPHFSCEEGRIQPRIKHPCIIGHLFKSRLYPMSIITGPFALSHLSYFEQECEIHEFLLEV